MRPALVASVRHPANGGAEFAAEMGGSFNLESPH